jgi:hypothetical protein
MKMAKSSTRKKHKIPPEVTQVIDAATDYIKQWTDREIERLGATSSTPICIPTKNGYRIGSYRLQILPNKSCELYNSYRELQCVFTAKLSAVLYTIYLIKQRFNDADEILLWDQAINKHYTDVLTLRRSIAKARKLQEYDVVDIRSARLEIAESELEIARDRISKLYNHAKYIKVWG